jgi:hypothetical protein
MPFFDDLVGLLSFKVERAVETNLLEESGESVLIEKDGQTLINAILPCQIKIFLIYPGC